MSSLPGADRAERDALGLPPRHRADKRALRTSCAMNDARCQASRAVCCSRQAVLRAPDFAAVRLVGAANCHAVFPSYRTRV